MADITEEQLKKEIAKILENADLAKTSTKKVIIQLEKNLGAELKDKKAIIDQLVMDYVNSKESGDEEASDAESEDASEKSDEAPKKKKPAKRAAAKPDPASDDESDEEETKKKKPKRQKAQNQKTRLVKSGWVWRKTRSSEEDSEEEKKPKKKGKKKSGGDSDDDWSKKKEKSSGPRKKPELPPEDVPLNSRLKKMMNLSVTSHQSEEMYRFMESHVELARGQMRSVDARESARKLWVELGDRLNALENGAAKTVHQWQRVWFDKKYIARKSALRINLNSNGSIGDELLDWEARVLAIIGVPLKSAAREDAETTKNFSIEQNYGILHNPPKTRSVEADTSQNSEGFGLHKLFHRDNFETISNDELDAYPSESHYNGESIQDGSDSPIAVESRDAEYIGAQQSAFQRNRVVGDDLQIHHSVNFAPTFQPALMCEAELQHDSAPQFSMVQPMAKTTETTSPRFTGFQQSTPQTNNSRRKVQKPPCPKAQLIDLEERRLRVEEARLEEDRARRSEMQGIKNAIIELTDWLKSKFG